MVQALTKKLKRSKAGFTLIELIVVIAILAILAAILIPSVTAYIGNARQGAADADARTVYTAAATVAANPNTTYTGYDGTTSAGTNPIKDSDLTNYLGTHSNFTITDITFTNGDVTSVKIHETNGKDGTYPKSGSYPAQFLLVK